MGYKINIEGSISKGELSAKNKSRGKWEKCTAAHLWYLSGDSSTVIYIHPFPTCLQSDHLTHFGIVVHTLGSL